MKLQKIILCVAICLTAFGASLGLLEIASYLRAAFAPLKVAVKPFEPVQLPVVYPSRIPEFQQPVLTPPEETVPIEEAEQEDQGRTGDYYLVGEKPKNFKDFDWLSIVDREYNEKLGKVVSFKPIGLIVINEGKDFNNEDKEFKFSWININGKRISLVTQAKKGVSYQFDGKFVEEEIKLKDENGEEYPEIIVLKGRLTKWRNGVKIAEAKVKFGLSHGC